MFVHGFATPDYIAHHVGFIVAGGFLRAHCFLYYEALILLSMEVSTPFLNVFLVLRHRGDKYQPAAKVCGMSFLLTYVFFRLILNVYGVYKLVVKWSEWW